MQLTTCKKYASEHALHALALHLPSKGRSNEAGLHDRMRPRRNSKFILFILFCTACPDETLELLGDDGLCGYGSGRAVYRKRLPD
jgi:hypothetical protein